MPLSRSKFIVSLIAILVVAAALLALVFRTGGGNSWEAMRARLEQLRIDASTRRITRSVLNGEPHQGNAWAEYNIALRDAQTWADIESGGTVALFVSGNPRADRAKVQALLATHATSLDYLRLGAKRIDGQYPYNWGRVNPVETPNQVGSRRLALLAVAQARVWTETGRAQEASELLLDLTVFAKDLATNGPLFSDLIGVEVYSVAIDELRNLILSRKLSRTQLATLAAKLEIADREFPKLSQALSNEAIHAGTAMFEAANGGVASQEWRFFARRDDSWRFAFSPRQMALDAFASREAFTRRSENFDEMDYAAARKEADAITAEAASSINPMTRSAMPRTPTIDKSVPGHREPLARLRLLRAGAVFLATGAIPTLKDPFGSDLLDAPGPDKLRIWSLGSDGNNDNGSGGWASTPAQKDIVLEIPTH